MNDLIIELEQDNIEFELEKNADNENIEIEENENVSTSTENNYRKLKNKPSINSVELIDNKTFEELGIVELTNSELERLLED